MIIAIEGHVFRSTPITPELNRGLHCNACGARNSIYPGLISAEMNMCRLLYRKSGGCVAYGRYWIEVKK